MRPSWDEYFLMIALVVSKRSTCARRNVGCVIVNSSNIILSTGYNGVAPNNDHCNENIGCCQGAQYGTGESLDKCHAIHAEQNALIQCINNFDVSTIYTTVFPCIVCTKLITATSCKRVVYCENYANSFYSKKLLNLFDISLVRKQANILHDGAA